LCAIEFEYTARGPDGRLQGTGETFTLEADQAFKAIGQRLDDAPRNGEEPPAVSGGRIRVDATRRTSLENVWAGGDCVAGPDLTVHAVQDGKIAAEAIHQFLTESQHG
jgi:glutamate synthase (NADPH/NADH) small chain